MVWGCCGMLWGWHPAARVGLCWRGWRDGEVAAEHRGVWGELSPVWVRMGWARGPLLRAEAARDPREPPQFPLVWSQPDGEPVCS